MSYTKYLKINKKKLPANIIDKEKYLFNDDIQIKSIGVRFRRMKYMFLTEDLIIFSFRRIVSQSFKHREYLKPNLYIAFKFILKHLLVRKKPKIKNGIWITDLWSCGYFHWFGDVIQKILLLEKEKLICRDSVLILPDEYRRFSFIQQSLNSFSYDIKYVKPDEVVFCNNLISVDFLFKSGNYVNNIMNKIREKYTANAYCNQDNGECFFISRNRATRRKILNEDEVIQSLEKFKFKTIFTEDLSWENQVKLFSKAKVIVSIHGAGLTNMLFMQKGCSIIEFRHPESKSQNCYFSLASDLNLNYYYIIGQPDSSDPHVSNLKIDLSKTETLLRQITNHETNK